MHAGQLGLGNKTTQYTPIELHFTGGVPRFILCGGEFSSVVTTLGYMYSAGSSGDGQLGMTESNRTDRSDLFIRLDLPERVEDATHGKYHNAVLTTNNHIYLTGIASNDGKLKQFKSLETVGLPQECVKEVNGMLRTKSIHSKVALHTAYRDILIAITPCTVKMSHFFVKLANCIKFYDTEIITVH